jgi:hypothetical protein
MRSRPTSQERSVTTLNLTGGDENRLTGDLINVIGNDHTISFSQCGQDTIVAYGNDDSISVSRIGSCDDNLYLLGGSDTLCFAYLYPTTMLSFADFQVWGFRAGDTVDLLPPESSAVKPDGHGGSFLTIGTTGAPATGDSTIHFMNTPTPVLSQALVHT